MSGTPKTTHPLHYPPDPAGTHPPLDFSGYRSTTLRAPSRPPVPMPQTRTELTAPLFGDRFPGPDDHDLTRQHAGEPLGERIIVRGRLLDGGGRPVSHGLVEVWQANAAGRYLHAADRHPAPLDPNFTGAGRCLTDADGWYEFVTIKPGAYPWRNHDNAWRPAHIHFSVFGRAFTQRLVTQMYFPGDPLFGQDPIYNSVPEAARPRMVSAFDLDATVPEWALAYRFDVVLRGSDATPFEEEQQ
jgi:protocatechuate 3,4-dioxygenase beta subunit